jgi:AcrR family transcriptional regulator
MLGQAARLFRDEGCAETSLCDISDACSIKTASLYYNFTEKGEIVTEVLSRRRGRRCCSHC